MGVSVDVGIRYHWMRLRVAVSLRVNPLTRSCAVILHIPLDEFLYADFEGCGRRKPDDASKIIHVRARFGKIARLRGQQLRMRAFAQVFLQQMNVLHQIHRCMVSDVVQAEGCRAGGRIGLTPIPVVIRSWHNIGDAQDPFYHIVNVGEVAFVFAVASDTPRSILALPYHA